MRNRIRKPSPALVIACVALFSSLTSAGVAAVVLAENSVGTRQIKNHGVKRIDVAGNVIAPQAFARIAANGTPQGLVAGYPSQRRGVPASAVVKGEAAAATGTYCFNIAFRPASAIVSLDNADTDATSRNLIASVAIDRGEDLGDCPSTHNDARVRIVDGNTEAAQDARFFIWFVK